jgi:hypothetical protein
VPAKDGFTTHDEIFSPRAATRQRLRWGVERSLARYNAGPRWIFDRRAATLAVLADLRRDWIPAC